MNNLDKKGEYSIHIVIYKTANGEEYTQYRGRVMTESGYWKVSKDFDTRTEAEMWCKSKRIQ